MTVTVIKPAQDRKKVSDAYELDYFVHKHAIARMDAIGFSICTDLIGMPPIAPRIVSKGDLRTGTRRTGFSLSFANEI
ncbi:hypothetical protein [Rhizobium brockwellii]